MVRLGVLVPFLLFGRVFASNTCQDDTIAEDIALLQGKHSVRKHNTDTLSETKIRTSEVSALNFSPPSLLASKDYAFAHEAPVWLPSTDRLVFTSNRLSPPSGNGNDYIEISTVGLSGFNDVEVLDREMWDSHIILANGAVLGRNGHIFILSQGNMDAPGGIMEFDPQTWSVPHVVSAGLSPTDHCTHMGRCDTTDDVLFNSPNDIVEDYASGALIFTDPMYGFMQGFRPDPALGNFLWIRHTNGTQQPLDTDHSRPNGVAFDGVSNETIYVTDSGYELGDGTQSAEAPNAIYKYDVVRDSAGEILALRNRRVFDNIPGEIHGIPDGIKVDARTGYIFVGLGSGVGVWEDTGDTGRLLQVISMPGDEGVANLALVPRDDHTLLVALCETKIYTSEIRGEEAIQMEPSEELVAECGTWRNRNTGGTCFFSNCFSWRGETECRRGRCLCAQGTCAAREFGNSGRRGVCFEPLEWQEKRSQR